MGNVSSGIGVSCEDLSLGVWSVVQGVKFICLVKLQEVLVIMGVGLGG